MRRLEAENCLMMPGNGHGSFLVRVSESRTGEYSLSGRTIFYLSTSDLCRKAFELIVCHMALNFRGSLKVVIFYTFRRLNYFCIVRHCFIKSHRQEIFV